MVHSTRNVAFTWKSYPGESQIIMVQNYCDGNNVNQQVLKDEILSLNIKFGETVKDYNLRYKKLFNKLNRAARESIQISDYVRTLKSKRKVWEGLVVKEFVNLEAYKLAVLNGGDLRKVVRSRCNKLYREYYIN